MANTMHLKQLSNGSQSETYKWISLHIFSYSNTYVLLRDLIAPIIEEINSHEYVAKCFYIIYGERGPHIRLRIQVEEDNLSIEEYVKLHIGQYLLLNSSSLLTEIERKEGWLDNDSVHSIAYEPEISRYGGPFAIEIAEEFFSISSYTILRLIKDRQINNYEDGLRYCIVMNIILAFTFTRGDLDESIRFFERIFAGRVGMYADRFIPVNYGFMGTYTQYFEEQKANLVPLVTEIWDALSVGATIGEQLVYWENGLNQIKEKLLRLAENNGVGFLYCFDTDPLWGIYDSYVHMNNNRLGIEPIDEPLVAVFISESLKRIKQNERHIIGSVN